MSSRPDLDAEARVTIHDVLKAREAWIKDAPAEYRDLLDATSEP
jgi:hypothetical protein